jgi:hypothetical protein
MEFTLPDGRSSPYDQERNRLDSLFARNYPATREINHESIPCRLIAVSIGREHGNTLIRTLRKTYGDHFAESCRDDEKLSDVLNKMDTRSLSRLLRDRVRGKLGAICRHA